MGTTREREKKCIYLLPACYTLTRQEKRDFCTILSEVKIPSGYSSYVRSFVQMKDMELINMKSCDCHTLMQHLLPIAVQNVLPRGVRNVMTRLCYFFNVICSKIVKPSKLEKLKLHLVETLCLFKKYFPPLFGIIVHLMVHLVKEV